VPTIQVLLMTSSPSLRPAAVLLAQRFRLL
jgi:hypothetical protein